MLIKHPWDASHIPYSESRTFFSVESINNITIKVTHQELYEMDAFWK